MAQSFGRLWNGDDTRSILVLGLNPEVLIDGLKRENHAARRDERAQVLEEEAVLGAHYVVDEAGLENFIRLHLQIVLVDSHGLVDMDAELVRSEVDSACGAAGSATCVTSSAASAASTAASARAATMASLLATVSLGAALGPVGKLILRRGLRRRILKVVHDRGEVTHAFLLGRCGLLLGFLRGHLLDLLLHHGSEFICGGGSLLLRWVLIGRLGLCLRSLFLVWHFISWNGSLV